MALLTQHQISIYKKEIKATLGLSYPIIIGQVGLVLMGVVDNIMIGNLGKAPLAAAGIANSIFFAVVIFGIGVLSIVPPLIANAKSQQNQERNQALLGNALRISFWIGLLSILIVFLLSLNFGIFQQKSKVEDLAIPYLNIINLSTIPMLVFLAFKNFTDGLSMTKPAMYATYVGLALNVFLNWLLIYGKLGFPCMGLVGAGWATLITRVAMAIFMFYFVLKSKKVRAFLPSLSLKYDQEISLKILKLGLPAGLQYFFEIGAFVSASVLIGWLGVSQLAAHNIAINLASLTYMVASGLAIAGSIRVGDAQGRFNTTETIRAGSSALFLSTSFMFLACLTFIFANNFLVSLYIDEIEVLSIASQLLIIAGIFQLSDGIQAVSLGMLRGIEDVNIPTAITLFAYWILALPLGYIFAFYWKMDVYGIWYGLSIGLSVSAVLLTVRFYLIIFSKKDKKEMSISNS